MFGSNSDYLKIFYSFGILILCSYMTADPTPLAIPQSIGNIKAPYWNPITVSLYFVSNDPSTVHRYEAQSGSIFSAQLDTDQAIAYVISLSDPMIFVTGLGVSVKTFSWDGVSNEMIPVDVGFVDIDVPVAAKVDTDRYVWIATNGDLFYLNDIGLPHQRMSHNFSGFAWSKFNSKIYIIDTKKSVLEQYDFPISQITTSNPPESLVFDFKKNGFDGRPTGITIDEENYAWIALSDSNKVACINPKNGTLVQTVSLPDGISVSSLAFGGPNMDILYVTTDKSGTSSDAGCLFQVVNTGSKGVVSKSTILKRLTR